MTEKIVQIAALVGAVVLGATLAASPAPAVPPHVPQLTITEVFVDFDNEEIIITGEHLDDPNTPTVLPGDDPTPLMLVSSNASEIVVELPASLSDGDYRLTVSTGPSAKRSDTYDLTIGAVGPKGADGADGADGVSGYEVISNPASVEAGQTLKVIASCPAGKRVMGGGFIAGGLETVVNQSYPGSQGTDSIVHGGNTGAQTLALVARAVCARVTTD